MTMKKPTILALIFTAFGFIGLAQNSHTSSKVAKEEGSIYTSLKPADAQPAVFTTKEELDAKIQDKKNRTLEQIKTHANDPAKVKALREQLWRFENAIVQPSATK
jgi:hypothetical protein